MSNAGYHILDWRINESTLGLDLAVIDRNPCPGVSWFTGTFIDEELPNPIVCELDEEDSGPDMPDFFDVDLTLCSDRMLAALRKAGVNSLQLFDAEIVNPFDNKTYRNYMAVNILDRVSCADLEKSTCDPSSGSPLIEFDELVLDRGRVGNHKMFRLAEHIGTIVVDGLVSDHLNKAGLVGVSLIPIRTN